MLWMCVYFKGLREGGIFVSLYYQDCGSSFFFGRGFECYKCERGWVCAKCFSGVGLVYRGLEQDFIALFNSSKTSVTDASASKLAEALRCLTNLRILDISFE